MINKLKTFSLLTLVLVIPPHCSAEHCETSASCPPPWHLHWDTCLNECYARWSSSPRAPRWLCSSRGSPFWRALPWRGHTVACRCPLLARRSRKRKELSFGFSWYSSCDWKRERQTGVAYLQIEIARAGEWRWGPFSLGATGIRGGTGKHTVSVVVISL